MCKDIVMKFQDTDDKKEILNVSKVKKKATQDGIKDWTSLFSCATLPARRQQNSIFKVLYEILVNLGFFTQSSY